MVQVEAKLNRLRKESLLSTEALQGFDVAKKLAAVFLRVFLKF